MLVGPPCAGYDQLDITGRGFRPAVNVKTTMIMSHSLVSIVYQWREHLDAWAKKKLHRTCGNFEVLSDNACVKRTPLREWHMGCEKCRGQLLSGAFFPKSWRINSVAHSAAHSDAAEYNARLLLALFFFLFSARFLTANSAVFALICALSSYRLILSGKAGCAPCCAFLNR